MALTQQEMEAATAYVHKEKNGDVMAIRFFSELAKDSSSARSQDFLAVRASVRAMSGYDNPIPPGMPVMPGPQYVGPSGGVQAAGPAGPQPSAGLATAGLTELQIKDCTNMTYLFAQDNHEGVSFFNGCMAGRAQGSQASAKMLTLRDSILMKMGWRKVGTRILPPSPEAVVEPLQPGPVVTQVVGAVAPTTTAVAVPTVPAVNVQPLPAAPKYLHEEEAAPAPLHENSGIISGVPSFDMPGAVDTIQAAIDDDRIFSASAVQSMLDEIMKLRAAFAMAPATVVAPANGAATTPATP